MKRNRIVNPCKVCRKALRYINGKWQEQEHPECLKTLKMEVNQ